MLFRRRCSLSWLHLTHVPPFDTRSLFSVSLSLFAAGPDVYLFWLLFKQNMQQYLNSLCFAPSLPDEWEPTAPPANQQLPATLNPVINPVSTTSDLGAEHSSCSQAQTPTQTHDLSRAHTPASRTPCPFPSSSPIPPSLLASAAAAPQLAGPRSFLAPTPLSTSLLSLTPTPTPSGMPSLSSAVLANSRAPSADFTAPPSPRRATVPSLRCVCAVACVLWRVCCGVCAVACVLWRVCCGVCAVACVLWRVCCDVWLTRCSHHMNANIPGRSPFFCISSLPHLSRRLRTSSSPRQTTPQASHAGSAATTPSHQQQQPQQQPQQQQPQQQQQPPQQTGRSVSPRTALSSSNPNLVSLANHNKSAGHHSHQLSFTSFNPSLSFNTLNININFCPPGHASLCSQDFAFVYNPLAPNTTANAPVNLIGRGLACIHWSVVSPEGDWPARYVPTTLRNLSSRDALVSAAPSVSHTPSGSMSGLPAAAMAQLSALSAQVAVSAASSSSSPPKMPPPQSLSLSRSQDSSSSRGPAPLFCPAPDPSLLSERTQHTDEAALLPAIASEDAADREQRLRRGVAGSLTEVGAASSSGAALSAPVSVSSLASALSPKSPVPLASPSELTEAERAVEAQTGRETTHGGAEKEAEREAEKGASDGQSEDAASCRKPWRFVCDVWVLGSVDTEALVSRLMLR